MNGIRYNVKTFISGIGTFMTGIWGGSFFIHLFSGTWAIFPLFVTSLCMVIIGIILILWSIE
jgi:hypothetical protein